MGKPMHSGKEWGHVVGNKSHRILCQLRVTIWGIRYCHKISVITEVLRSQLVYKKKKVRVKKWACRRAVDVSETEGIQEGLGDLGVDRTLNSRKALQQKWQEEVTDAELSGSEDAMKDTHPDDLHTMGLTGSRVKLQNLRALWIELMGFRDQSGSFPGEHICNQQTLGWGSLWATVRAWYA